MKFRDFCDVVNPDFQNKMINVSACATLRFTKLYDGSIFGTVDEAIYPLQPCYVDH